MDDLLNIFAEGKVVCLLQGFDTAFFPYIMKAVGRTFHLLIRSYPVETAHEKVTIDNCLEQTVNQGNRPFKAFILLDTLHTQTDNRDMPIAVFGQAAPDKSDVIGSTAASAGLGNDDGCLIQVLFTGGKSSHNLSHHDQGRVACVIVYIF